MTQLGGGITVVRNRRPEWALALGSESCLTKSVNRQNDRSHPIIHAGPSIEMDHRFVRHTWILMIDEVWHDIIPA